MRVHRLLLLSFMAVAPELAEEKTHELCKVCHTETVRGFLAHPHSEKGLDCDTCHGQSIKHRTSQGHTEPDRIAAPHETPSLCSGCHGGEGGPGSILAQYSNSKHGKLVLEKSRVRAPHCGTCHGVHAVRSARAIESQCKRCHQQLPAVCTAASAVDSKPVSCTRCHVPHVFGVKR